MVIAQEECLWASRYTASSFLGHTNPSCSQERCEHNFYSHETVVLFVKKNPDYLHTFLFSRIAPPLKMGKIHDILNVLRTRESRIPMHALASQIDPEEAFIVE